MHLFLTLFIFAIFNCDFTNACPLPHGGSKINLLYKWGVCFSCSTKWSKANLQDSILETKEVEPTSSKKLRKKKKKELWDGRKEELELIWYKILWSHRLLSKETPFCSTKTGGILLFYFLRLNWAKKTKLYKEYIWFLALIS